MITKKHRRSALAGILVCMLLSLSLARGSAGGAGIQGVDGGATPLFHYQGLLTDPVTGEPVPDGSYQLTFKIYDHATSLDPGHLLWTEV